MNNGESAKGEAEVTIRVGDTEYRASGIDQDVVIAVARAYIGACNQAVREGNSVDGDASDIADDMANGIVDGIA